MLYQLEKQVIGYYESRISLKLGNGGVGKSPRIAKGGKTEELAVLHLLQELAIYLDNYIKGNSTPCKINENVPQKLLNSINNLRLTSPEITQNTLLVVNKINDINAKIDNMITIPNNVLPFNIPQQLTTLNSVVAVPTPVANNFTNIPVSNVPYKSDDKILIEDIFMEWLQYRKNLTIKSKKNPKTLGRKTFDNNRNILYDEIFPIIQKRKLIYLFQLTPEIITSVLDEINCQNTKNKAYICLNMLFKYAIKNNKSIYNPMEKVDKPPEKIITGDGKDDEDDNYIEPDRQNIWLDTFEQETIENKNNNLNTDMSILFEVMLLTGIRPEEACGLKWTALDLNANELIINNAYKEFDITDENMNIIGHERGDDKLKTPESYRKIPLDINPRLKNLLLNHQKDQQLLFKKSRALKDNHRKWSENEYMFLGRNYHPYVSESLSYGLRKIRAKYNLEKVTPYGLRHSFATYWSQMGLKDIILQSLMGHTDFETTKKWYIKVTKKHIEQEIKKVNKAS